MTSPRTLLILDEASVARAPGATFHLNRATKHPENPVMSPGEPHQWDSLQVSWPGTVLYNARDKKFRCWYSGFDVVQSADRVWNVGYAESVDGVNWAKPDCRQVEFLGKPTNQLKLKPAQENTSVLSCVFENPNPGAPESQRFGGYWIEVQYPDETKKDFDSSLWVKSLAWSPDGITWTRAATAYGGKPRAPFLDISQVLFDPADPDPSMRWKAYGQIFIPRPDGSGWPGIRNIGIAVGADVSRVEDAEQLVVLAPQAGVDEELHFAAVQKVGATYVMLFESDRFSKHPIHGDLRLAVSEDGRNFRRVHAREPVVATGPKGMWDENLLVTNSAGMQEVGDEIYIHYFGCPSTYTAWPMQYAVASGRRGSQFAPSYLGLATLPRDRYGYASGAGGIVTTRPLELDDGALWLNATGEIASVELLDEQDRVVARGALTDERRQTVYRKVKWAATPPQRGKHKVQVTLGDESCRLFSLQH